MECWLALAALERDVPDRQEAAKEALAEALKEITSYATRGTGDTRRFGESQVMIDSWNARVSIDYFS